MKKDISIIRESIGRIVSMLTNQKIKVTQRGTNAYVKYHPKTGAIIDLNIPYIPDDASEEFIAAIQGFLDHEVGHILFSDFPALKKATSEGVRVANLANIIEDVFVERKMSEAFRGSGANLESTRKFYLEKIARAKIDAALTAGNIEEARGYATVAALRAWGGQTTAMDFIREPVIAELVKPVADKLGAELMDAIGKCNSSDQCLELARKCLKALEKSKPKPPPEPKPEEGSGEDSALDSTVPDDIADLIDKMKKDAEDEGSTSVEDDDSGKTGSEEADAVDDDGSESGSDSKGKKSGDKDPEGEPEDDPEDEPEDDGDDLTEPSSPGEGSGEDEKDERDGKADISAEGEESDGGPGKDDADAEEGGEGSSGEPAEKGSASPDEPVDSDDAPVSDPLADMFDTERDFDKDMGEKISKDAKEESSSASYSVFSTDWDVIEPAPLAHSPKSIEKMEDSIKDKIGVMQKQLERGIAALARKSWNSGQTRGRIATGNLFKTAVGDDRVFRQRFETKAKNVAVSLVVDCSGSMNGGRIKLAGLAAYALSTVLERLKVTHEVIGFTSRNSSEMLNLMQEDARTHSSTISRMNWARHETIYMPVFKPFAGKLDTSAKSRIAHLTENPGWLEQNVDGECIKLAARRLVQQKAQRHIMIVMSDGDPCCSSGKGLNPHLKKTVQEMTAQNVEVIGIGINSTSVKSYYPKHVVLNDAEELPSRVMSELSKLLLAA